MGRDLFRLRAHEMRHALRKGDATAVEITESALGRIDAVDPAINAFVSVWRDEALETASAIDGQLAQGKDPGPLAGVPVAVKDNFCATIGTTECGSRILKGFQSPYNATVIQRLHDAGAIVLGKCNMDEFAMGSSTENSSIQTTKNPWDPERVPGGSSGGAAAALVSEMAAITFGSDTGGSIRQPAAFCGCIGMKPTYGRVSRFGLVAFASSLDQIGPFARDARDLALALNTICGHDSLDATSADQSVPDFTTALHTGVNDLTLGLPQEYFTGALAPEVRERVEAAVDTLRGQGATIVNVELPHTEYSIATYYIICTAEASANLARFDGIRYGYRDKSAHDIHQLYRRTKSAGFGPEVQRRIMLGTYALSSGYYDAYYLKAQQVRALIRRDFEQAFEKCDAIITPTAPSPAFRIGEKTSDPLEMYLSDIYTTSINLAGLPAVSVPCGQTDDGLPVGVQFIGKPFDEALLVRLTHAYESTRGFDMGRPEIP